MDEYSYISGAISGAITDPMSIEAIIHSEKFYEFIRKNTTDVEKIARNTKFTFDQILMIKNYLFINKHNLDGELKLFDPCFEIAQSWQRLAFQPEYIQQHDITLIKHELYEMELINKGYSQEEAHNKTELKYNYNLESKRFYDKLKTRHNNLTRNSIISGGITYRTH